MVAGEAGDDLRGHLTELNVGCYPTPPDQSPGPAPGFAVSELAAGSWLRLSGEVDLCTVDILKRAITALPPEADEIHLQLPRLKVVNVAAARELVALTTRPGRPRLVLHYPPPTRSGSWCSAGPKLGGTLLPT